MCIRGIGLVGRTLAGLYSRDAILAAIDYIHENPATHNGQNSEELLETQATRRYHEVKRLPVWQDQFRSRKCRL